MELGRLEQGGKAVKTPKVLISTAKEQEDWRRELSVQLPEADLYAGMDAPICDYAVVRKPEASLFATQTQLKAIFSLGAGVNGLLAIPTLPKDIPLVRMEDAGMASQMVEYALYAALRQFRRFSDYRQDQLRATWSPRPARSRNEFCIGVLGLGALGAEIARALAQFGFRVSGWSRTAKTIPDVTCEQGDDGLRRMLARSEMLLVLLPLTDATRGLLDETRMGQLPVGASIVNLARGELLDENALISLLDNGHIGETHLDVFEHEPLPSEHPFWRHPRVRMTPHIAALTDARLAARQVASKIRQLEAGHPITGVVDRRAQY